MVSYSKTVGLALQAAELLAASGVSVEVWSYGIVMKSPLTIIYPQVINLRSVRPLDIECIKKSVMKTHHLITVENGWPMFNVGAEVLAQISESKLPIHLNYNF